MTFSLVITEESGSCNSSIGMPRRISVIGCPISLGVSLKSSWAGVVNRFIWKSLSTITTAVSTLSIRLTRSSFKLETVWFRFLSSSFKVVSSSLVDCNSSLAVSNSSFVLINSSLPDCNSSIEERSSSLVASCCSITVCNVSLVDCKSSLNSLICWSLTFTTSTWTFEASAVCRDGFTLTFSPNSTKKKLSSSFEMLMGLICMVTVFVWFSCSVRTVSFISLLSFFAL